MGNPRGYASVPERITWTVGFRCPTDKHVLGALSTFASFETGKGARMNVQTLTARAHLAQRTVERALARLRADGWIVPRRRHRHATIWDINVDRLATDWVSARLVAGPTDTNLTVNRGGQIGESDTNLTVNRGGQIADLAATSGGQDPDLTATSGGPIQVRTYVRSPVPLIPCRSAPALRAGLFDDDAGGADSAKDGHVPEQATTDADVCPDDRPDPDDAGGGPGRQGSDHQAPPGARVQLRQPADPPSAESDPRPRATVEPHQTTFGPIDVDPSPARPAPQWGQLAEALRKGLEQHRRSG